MRVNQLETQREVQTKPDVMVELFNIFLVAAFSFCFVIYATFVYARLLIVGR